MGEYAAAATLRPRRLLSMSNAENIFLVGPMGSGKSAVGRRLAARLGLEFRDSDAEIESRTGVSIPYIFEKEGEAGFRARERETLDLLTGQPGVLVATGGGAVLDADTRERLRSRGRVVYLRTSVDQQLARTRRSAHRPLLNTPDPRAALERLMQQRAALYEEVAEVVVDTDGRKVGAVVDEIVSRLAKPADA
jgi:shikimate kinase